MTSSQMHFKFLAILIVIFYLKPNQVAHGCSQQSRGWSSNSLDNRLLSVKSCDFVKICVLTVSIREL
jgi:hypothetical protein